MPLLDPPRWTDEQLDEDRLTAIKNFIEARQRELSPLYDQRLSSNIDQVAALFDATADLLTLAEGSVFASDPGLTAIARYLAGPPISADDFDTLAGQSIAKRRRLSIDLARVAAELLSDVLDRRRFPWLYAVPPRKATSSERELAVGWTAGLKTAQEVATTLRGASSRAQEAGVRATLRSAGYGEVRGGDITMIDDVGRSTFRAGETRVAGAKCDIPVRLHDGRLLLIECKVSNSGTNSVKRLIRETVGKASQWHEAFGTQAITMAVLAGVYRMVNLVSAQRDGVIVIWQHDLDPLAEFVTNAVR